MLGDARTECGRKGELQVGMNELYWMQFSVKVLDVMKEAEPPVLSEDEYMDFLKAVKKLAEEKIEELELLDR